MAGRPKHADDCPFNRLSDELLILILQKASVTSQLGICSSGVWKLPGGPWFLASKLNRFSAVCQRFKALRVQEVTEQVVWELGKAESMAGAKAVDQVGPCLRGLMLNYTRANVGTNQQKAGASMELLTGILKQCPNLSTFCLNFSMRQQGAEASDHILGLLRRRPLENLLLLDSELSLVKPLRVEQRFQDLEVASLKGLHLQIMDEFLHSFLDQSPKLRELSIFCTGLNQPCFSAPGLQKLDMCELDIASKELIINAPKLEGLQAVPGLRRFRLHAPMLDVLALAGPILELETPDCQVRVSELRIAGKGWHLDQVASLIGQFGVTRRIELDVTTWHEESQTDALSNFLDKVPLTARRLCLSKALEQLYDSNMCKEVLQKIKFECLEYLQFTVTGVAEFDSIPLVLNSCPNLKTLEINLEELKEPILGLVTRVLDLQRAYPQIKMEYEEPVHFISSRHLLSVARVPRDLQALLQELREWELVV